MLSLTTTGTELRRFRRGMLPKVAIVALILIPLLYGALYLWAFWDPTGRMNRLPVALVNADTGATHDGAAVHAGDDVVTQLVKSGDLDWQTTDATEAAAGVKSGRYYFAVTIPASFSRDVTSVGGDHPSAAQIDVTYNDANSFLASTLGKTAMAQVRDAVASSIGSQQVDQVLVGLGSARDGFAQASDGAITLTAASGQLSSGAHQLAAGAGTAASGAASLASGATKAAGGASTLAAGAKTLDTSASALAQGAAQAATGATSLDAGAAQVAAGAHQASTTVAGLAGGLSAMSTDLNAVAGYLVERATVDGDAQAGALAARLGADAGALPDAATTQTMVASLNTLDQGAAQVAAGTGTLASNLGTLSSGAGQLAAGAHQLSTGATSLASGTSQVATGASTLATGVASLSAGASTLAAGSDELTTGSQTLGTSLADGAKQIPADSTAARTQRASTISDPVALSSTHVATAQGFGEGFAPFFLSLALFVGSLITWLLLRPIPSRALAGAASDWRVTLNGYLPALSLGVLQVAVMLGVIHFGLGLSMASTWGTIGLTLLVVAAFMALQQMLLALLGTAAGKVAILALLMFQLASSGGTYPVETTPAFFRVLHPLLPMSYAVTGLRHTITGDLGAASLWQSVLVLVGVLVGSLAVTVWRTGRMRTWTMSRLHPALSL